MIGRVCINYKNTSLGIKHIRQGFDEFETFLLPEIGWAISVSEEISDTPPMMKTCSLFKQSNKVNPNSNGFRISEMNLKVSS